MNNKGISITKMQKLLSNRLREFLKNLKSCHTNCQQINNITVFWSKRVSALPYQP